MDGIGKDALGRRAAAALEAGAEPCHTRRRSVTRRSCSTQLKQDVSTDGRVAIYKPVELRRVKPLTIAMVIGLLFALWVILGRSAA